MRIWAAHLDFHEICILDSEYLYEKIRGFKEICQKRIFYVGWKKINKYEQKC